MHDLRQPPHLHFALSTLVALLHPHMCFAAARHVSFLQLEDIDSGQHVTVRCERTASDRLCQHTTAGGPLCVSWFDDIWFADVHPGYPHVQLEDIDFGRRVAVERELAASASEGHAAPNAVFDESGQLLLYPTLLGVKVVNLVSNKVVRILGECG